MERTTSIIIQYRKSWTEKLNELNLLISLESAIKKSLMNGVERERERERANLPRKSKDYPTM